MSCPLCRNDWPRLLARTGLAVIHCEEGAGIACAVVMCCLCGCLFHHWWETAATEPAEPA